jgi:hypothetical protein
MSFLCTCFFRSVYQQFELGYKEIQNICTFENYLHDYKLLFFVMICQFGDPTLFVTFNVFKANGYIYLKHFMN